MPLRSLLLAPTDGREPSTGARIFGIATALLLLAALFTFSFQQLTYAWNWSSIARYQAKFFQGWTTTVVVSLFALAASVLLGLLIALARRSRLLPLRGLAEVYVELIRGTPLLVQILVFFYVVAESFRITDRYVVGVLVLAVFSAAYISEIIRAGIESVGRSQLESARAVGFTPGQILRYVVFPQTLRQSLPALAGEFASLIKNSSLLSVIAVREFTLNAQEVNAFTASTFESYLPLAAGYLVLTLPISLWTRWLEARHRYET